MAQPRMRPRFVIEIACSADEVMSALRADTSDAQEGVEGRFTERHGVLKIEKNRRRFWTPELSLTIQDGDEPGVTEVFGIFSPQPEIWTGFVFAIGTLVTLGLFGIMWGIVQLTLGWSPWALAAPVLTGVLGALVYTATLVGQGLGAADMYRLRSFLDRRLDAAREQRSRQPRTARDSAQL